MTGAPTDRFTWTSRGVAALVAGLAALLAGTLVERPLVSLVGACILLALSLDAVAVRGLRPHAQIACEPGRVPEEGTSHVTIQLRHSHHAQEYRVALAPGLEVSAGKERWMGARHQRSMDFEVRGRARGPNAVGPLFVRRWSPLRLWCREFTDAAPATLEVTPRPEDPARFGLRSQTLRPLTGRFQVNRPGQGFEFFTLRQYQSGDTIRSINWKASARTDDLIVNQVARETSGEIVFLLDHRVFMAAGPVGNSPLDQSCRIALALFTEALQSRDRIHFLSYGSGVHEPPEARGGRLHALETFLASLGAAGQDTVGTAWDAARGRVRSPGPLVLFTSAEQDPELPTVVADAVRRGHTTTVVSPQPDGPTWDADPARQARRTDTLRETREAGAIVVDWAPGRPLLAETPPRLGAFA